MAMFCKLHGKLSLLSCVIYCTFGVFYCFKPCIALPGVIHLSIPIYLAICLYIGQRNSKRVRDNVTFP